MFKLFDVVQLTVDLPEFGLVAGDMGTVVEVFDQPSVAYDIEIYRPINPIKDQWILAYSVLPEQIVKVASDVW